MELPLKSFQKRGFKPWETIVEVKWNDHQLWSGWRSKDEIEMKMMNDKSALKCQTVGYYLGEDDNSVFVALSMSDGESANSVKQILKTDILHIRGLIL